MKKQQVDHVLRAAGRITGEKQFIIIGSQSLYGKYPDVPDEILTSFEVDLIASKNADRTARLNVIGVDSPFHESVGYYADPVDDATATLPKGWKGRDRKSTRLNSSHRTISYAVFCLKKKK